MTPLVLDLAARTRAALGWWMLGILAMATYVVVAYDTMVDLDALSELYESYPPALRQLFGEVDLSTMDGWIQVELVSYLPLLLAIYGGIYAAGAVSRETEQRTIDFILGLPVSRTDFIASRIIVGLLNLFSICLAVFLFLVIGVALVGRTPSAGNYALALLNAFLLSGALLTAYVAIATVVDEQSRLTGITLGLTFVLYILTAAFQVADVPDVVRWLTPFEHYHSAQAMTGEGLPALPMVALAAAMALAAAASVYWYNRRDL